MIMIPRKKGGEIVERTVQLSGGSIQINESGNSIAVSVLKLRAGIEITFNLDFQGMVRNKHALFNKYTNILSLQSPQ